MIRLEAPGGGMNTRVRVLHPQVVLVRPSVIVDLKETIGRVPYKTSALHPKQMNERKEGRLCDGDSDKGGSENFAGVISVRPLGGTEVAHETFN